MSYGLQVKVVEGRNLKAADIGGTSDPYCLVSLGSEKGRTRVIQKTLNPVWNQTFRLQMTNPEDTEFKLTCWDKDTLSSDDFLGQVSIDLKNLPIDGSDVWLPLKSRKDGESVRGEICVNFSVVPMGPPVAVQFDVNPMREIGDSLMDDEDGAPPADADDDLNSLLGIPSTRAAPAAPSKARTVRGQVGDVKDRIADMRNTGVRDLDASALGLTGCPKQVLELTDLLNLNLGFNKIVEFPNLQPLSDLEVLDLSGNQIKEINASIGSLPRLRELIMRGNQLTYIPIEIVDLHDLVKLDLGNNHIEALPAEIGRNKALEELYLQGNPIKIVPPTIGNLTNMEIMDMSDCQIDELPEEFTRQTKLIELNLAQNNLRVLPVSFGRLTRLATLNVSANQLVDLPMSMGYCGGMTVCQIDGNPIRSQEMMRKYKLGFDHLVDFLEKRMVSYKIKTGTDLDTLLFGKEDTEKHGPKAQEDAPLPEVTAEQKFAAMKMEARGICQDILLHLGDLRKELLRTTALSEAIKYAQQMRRIKDDVMRIRNALPPLPVVQMPIIHPGEEKLIAFQKTVNGAIRETEVVLVGLQQALANAPNAQVLLPLVKLIKPVKLGLGL